ncbi:hypothetical protein HOLleu_06258 [Holothuria leucospilota]|uniref:Uncharacterized protein n=1 Tax=Holothuria leucospilota TaxID=206669 RepID=A0A9Q1CMK2_HOLLE|nr:hypothetical protein HOLleu_06258 [Holothuria leucospilota]
MRQLQPEPHRQLQGMFQVPTSRRRSQEDPAEEDPAAPEDPASPPGPTQLQTTANDNFFCSPQIIEDIKRKHDETIAKMEERHQHQATIEKIEETNNQLFHQMREDTIIQLHQLKGQITHFLGDVLTCLIPEKGDTPPSDYRKATVIKENAWSHLGLDIDISRIREELRKKSPRDQKTSTQ